MQVKYTVFSIYVQMIELHGAWFLEVAQHQLVFIRIKYRKRQKFRG